VSSNKFSTHVRWLWFLLCAAAITGCDFAVAGGPRVVTKVVVLTQVPTTTTSPILTRTQRFTATLIPTVTPLPTNTLPATLTPTPFIPTTAPSPTPLPLVRGEVRSTVNFRVGPGRNFDATAQLERGTQLTLLSYDETREWFLVRLDDGQRGWVQATFITTDFAETVPVLPAVALTQVALATQAPTQAAPPSPVPTLRWRIPQRTDILAYCDLPRFKLGFGGRSLSPNAAVTIYWTWEATTPEQIQDHVDNATYEVKLNGKALDGWQSSRTGVRAKQGGKLEVMWLVSVGKLSAGEYTVDYKVSWSQKIEDGETTYGPGGEFETETGSCKFTIR
jgi:SH3-like domain-containing protein